MPYNNDMKKIVWIALIIVAVSALFFVLAACGGAEPTKLTVTKAPDTLKVIQGEEPDLSGGLVEVEFSDGSVKEFPMTEMSVKGLKKDTLGTQTVALSYTAKGKTVTATVDLTVVLPKVTALSLQTEGVKTSYVEGEIFNKQGLVVTATYQTGESAVVPNYEISPAILSSTTKAIKITYRGVSAEIPVTVSPHAPVSMTVVDPLAKTSYFVGERFISEGLSMAVAYNDGTTEIFAADNLVFQHSYGTEYSGPLSETDNVVTVIAVTKYGTISTSLQLTVALVVPVRLTVTMHEELSFLEGDPFAFDDANEAVSVLVEYNDGSERNLLGSFDYFTYDGETLTATQTAVTIWIAGYPSVTASVPVTVAAPQVTDISVLNPPAKTDYVAGESVDLTGLILMLTMSNGRFAQLSYSDGCGITTPTLVVAETQTMIEVNYLGFSARFSINVAV